MKKFSGNFQGKYRKMPKTPEEPGNSPAEALLPEEKSCSQPQIIAHPQVSTADAEEGKKPAQQQLQTDHGLAQQGVSSVEGPEKVHSGTQQHSAEDTAQEPTGGQGRGQRRSPRFGRGSS